jgi:sterol 14-demethylase
LCVCSGDKKFLPDVLAEQQRVMAKHGDNLDFDILQEMDYLHRAIKEVGFP